MGVLDKIKNALFEVEYVEVEEKPKKEKKVKPKEKTTDGSEEEKPIAKKIVLPGKKEDKVEEIQEVELKDEDFEIRPKDEKVKEVFQENFNVMDDDIIALPPENIQYEVVEQPIVEEKPVEEKVEERVVKEEVTTPVQSVFQEPTYANKDYVKEYDSYKEKVYSTIHDDYRVKAKESKPYGMDPSYQVSIKEYGTESKDDKNYFKPSPIISPIYGILDKNYKKEDVVSKKEIHITSSYAKANVNVDDIRNKAYGKHAVEEAKADEIEEEPPKTTPFVVEEEDDENLLVDLTDEKKPEVKELTVGDAMEYYHDLGLEYNVDYVDASGKNAPKTNPNDLEEEIKDTIDSSDNPDEPVIEKTMEVSQEEINGNSKVESAVEENKQESTLDDDDNLFDLIDSMYKEEVD